MRILTRLATITLLLPSPLWASECAEYTWYDWLEGHWVAEAETTTFFESWRRDQDGALMGVAEAKKAGETGALAEEEMRLFERDGVLVYSARLEDAGGPVEFTLARCEPEGRAVFENPDHDFLQRLVYQAVDADHFTAHVTDLEDRGFVIEFERADFHAPDEE